MHIHVSIALHTLLLSYYKSRRFKYGFLNMVTNKMSVDKEVQTRNLGKVFLRLTYTFFF
jgi:hypothetical protein